MRIEITRRAAYVVAVAVSGMAVVGCSTPPPPPPPAMCVYDVPASVVNGEPPLHDRELLTQPCRLPVPMDGVLVERPDGPVEPGWTPWLDEAEG